MFQEAVRISAYFSRCPPERIVFRCDSISIFGSVGEFEQGLKAQQYWSFWQFHNQHSNICLLVSLNKVQDMYASRQQCIKTSGCLSSITFLRVCGMSLLTTCMHQGNNASRHQGIITSRHHNIRVSKFNNLAQGLWYVIINKSFRQQAEGISNHKISLWYGLSVIEHG